MVGHAQSRADILADKRAVLRRRGVPEKFVNEVAELATPTALQSMAQQVGLGAWFIFLLVPLVVFRAFRGDLASLVYGARVRTSDLFVPGFMLDVAWIWLLASLVALPPLVLFVRKRFGARREATTQQSRAATLCDKGLRSLRSLHADPRLAALADQPSAQAFLSAADRLAQPVSHRRRNLLAAAGGWGLVTLGLCGLARSDYTDIHGRVIDYAAYGAHVRLPLARVSDVVAACYYSDSRSEENAQVTYNIEFGNHRIDLFSVANANGLDRIVQIDDYLKASGVPMQKFAPYAQLSHKDRQCLDKEGIGDGANQPQRRQLIFG